jgi:HK97 family phage major capsid protein/HK97 family phage prohead protease
MAKDALKLKPFHRTFEFDRAAIDVEKRTVELSFSSELPVDRWFGKEILDHEEKSVDLSRLNGAAPLLVNHDFDFQVGVVENARVEGKKGYATVRFSKSARGQEVFDEVNDGIRKLVSVGYRILKVDKKRDEPSGVETWRAIRWLPYEISIVSVPADPTVGVGRNHDQSENEVEIIGQEPPKGGTPTTQGNNMNTRNLHLDPDPPTGGGGAPPEKRADVEVIQNKARELERDRIKQINFIRAKQATRVAKMDELADKAIAEDTDINEFRRIIFENMDGVERIDNPDPKIGMSDKQIGSYDLRKAILEFGDNKKLSGLEGECSREFALKQKRDPQGFWVPEDVLAVSRDIMGRPMKRDAVVATASLGGNVVATNLLAGSFIEMLRNRMVLSRAGMITLPGLVGNVAIPRQTGGATVYWATEVATSTESDATFDQVSLAPKGATAMMDYSKLLLTQSTPAIDALLQMDIAKQLAIAIDLAGLHGSASGGQPRGVINVSGIADISDTNGGAPTWADMVNLEKEIAVDNADVGSLAYITNPLVRAKMKTVEKATNTGLFLWSDVAQTAGADGIPVGQVNGYRAFVTNQVASNLTQGNSTTICSALFFGNWSDLLLAMWGGLDLLVDPYTQGATRVYRLLASQYVDYGARHAQSFAVDKGVLVT